MALKQKVVRTFPQGWSTTTSDLQVFLNEGWKVKMRTIIKGDEGEAIEYILEKDE